MKYIATILVFLVLIPVAFAQGAFIPVGQALRTVNGFTTPLANATITVCAANASGIPCAPVTISIFADAALTQPLSNPFTADASGNYIFAVAPGTYTITVTGFGFNGYSYQVSVSSSAGVPVPPAGSGSAPPGFSFPLHFNYAFGDVTTGAVSIGSGNQPSALGTRTGIGNSATETQGSQSLSAASASVNVVAAVTHNIGANPGQGIYSFGTMARYSTRLKLLATSNVRYWIGATDGQAADFNGASATFATDTPNRYYCMFRYSAGTDATIKAICATDSTHQTIVDTTVAVDTSNSMVFEIAPNSTTTSFQFFINGISRATITTNIPTAVQAYGTVWTADNKNTATAVGAVFYWSQMMFTK